MNTESVQQLRKALYNGILWTAARHFEWGVDAEGGWGFVASPKGENVGVWGRSPQKDVPGTPWLPVGRRMSCACMAAAIGKTPVECMPLHVCYVELTPSHVNDISDAARVPVVEVHAL